MVNSHEKIIVHVLKNKSQWFGYYFNIYFRPKTEYAPTPPKKKVKESQGNSTDKMNDGIFTIEI